MKKDFEKRLKGFLLELIKQEGNFEAWDHYTRLNPSGVELIDLILFSPIDKEAWELLKKQQGTKENYLHIVAHVENADIKMEAATILMNNYPLDNESLEIIVKSTESDAAAGALLNQNPNNEQLETIMACSNLQDEAASELLNRSPNNDELYEIILLSNLKLEAWNIFIQQSPTIQEIIQIIDFTDLEEIAWEYLLKQNPTNEELLDFVNDYAKTGRKKMESAEIILANNPDQGHLISLIKNSVFTNNSFEKLKKLPVHEIDASAIVWSLIRLGSDIINEVADWCLTMKLSQKDLFYILEYTDRKDEAALQLLQTPLELHQLADVIVHSTIDQVLKLASERVELDLSKVNESELILEIAEKLIANPELLDANNWHKDGKHCLGGWAITLHEPAKSIEQKYGSEITACLLLPNYKHLFFADRETVLSELKRLV